ncbi:glycosyltransferase [bacterium]|nr:glycosyltransferase [bacterium]
MNILVNYLPVDKGGGLQNAVNFWRASLKNSDDNWFALARKESPIVNLEQNSNHKIIALNVPKSYILRLIYDQITINYYAKKFNIDVIFTIVGPGPLISPYTKINGWHDAFMVYPESKAWRNFSLKSRISLKLKYQYTKLVLKQADKISVQTDIMKKRMIDIAKIDENRIFITPNGINTFTNDEYFSEKHEKDFLKVQDKIKLLLLAEPAPHKNFEYLFDIAKILKNREKVENIVFIISIDENSNSLAQNFIKKVYQERLEKLFLFIGKVKHREIKTLYNKIDAVFLPTLLESFSANYAEALFFKKPIFTSDLDFAKGVCGEFAIYFDPFNPLDGLNKILDFYSDNEIKERYLKKIESYSIKYPDWDEKFDKYYQEIKSIKKLKI